ncbi:MAG: hypothetical protein KDK96_08580 [Chlamydiia bacterium]|nr:hypothetical protein [Chlamydiia bacterium]
MTSIQSVQNLGIVSAPSQDQESKLPFNIQRDLYDLQTALAQLKDNPKLDDDESFQHKMEDYLSKYVDDYNADVKDGSLTFDQQIVLSDLNEDLETKGLIRISSDGTIDNPNNPSTIGPILHDLLNNEHGVDWIDIINSSITSIQKKYS